MIARFNQRSIQRQKRSQTACKPGSVVRLSTRDGHSSGPPLAGRFSRPTRTARTGDGPAGANSGAPPLFGLAPGGACHAVPIAGSAVGSYPTLSPLPPANTGGGLLSVALSLRSPSAGVARRHIAVEPGLSSTPRRAPRPSGRLARIPTAPKRSQGQVRGWPGTSSKPVPPGWQPFAMVDHLPLDEQPAAAGLTGPLAAALKRRWGSCALGLADICALLVEALKQLFHRVVGHPIERGAEGV